MYLKTGRRENFESPRARARRLAPFRRLYALYRFRRE